MQKSHPIGRGCAALTFLSTLLIAGGMVSAQAQNTAVTDAPPPPPKYPWETTAAAGLTLTRGNSKTLLATLTLESKRKWEKNEALFGIAGGYGEDRDVKNTEFINGFGQYNRLFSDRFYAGLRVDANYDAIAGLDYRVRVSPLAGYYLIKNTNTLLSVEVGPSAVFEKQKGRDQETYLGFRLGQRFEHKLSATTKIWESLDYVPRVDEWTEKYVLTGELGIDSAITKHWSLRVVLQNIYDSQPAAGRLHNDTRLVAGTAYKF